MDALVRESGVELVARLEAAAADVGAAEREQEELHDEGVVRSLMRRAEQSSETHVRTSASQALILCFRQQQKSKTKSRKVGWGWQWVLRHAQELYKTSLPPPPGERGGNSTVSGGGGGGGTLPRSAAALRGKVAVPGAQVGTKHAAFAGLGSSKTKQDASETLRRLRYFFISFFSKGILKALFFFHLFLFQPTDTGETTRRPGGAWPHNRARTKAHTPVCCAPALSTASQEEEEGYWEERRWICRCCM